MSVKSTVDRIVSRPDGPSSAPMNDRMASIAALRTAAADSLVPGIRRSSHDGSSDAAYATSSVWGSSSSQSSRAGTRTAGSTPRTSVSFQISLSSRATSGVPVWRLNLPIAGDEAGSIRCPVEASTSRKASPNAVVPQWSSIAVRKRRV